MCQMRDHFEMIILKILQNLRSNSSTYLEQFLVLDLPMVKDILDRQSLFDLSELQNL